MASLKFGLNPSKLGSNSVKAPQKRRAVFGNDNEDEDEQVPPAPQATGRKTTKPFKPLNGFDNDGEEKGSIAVERGPPARKSPKLSHPTIEKYASLSAMRSAKLQDQQAAELDASVYDYDGVWDTIHASTKKTGTDADGGSSGPKYMTSLLKSAEVRKRDQVRAKEKLLQKEREAEGDEFADKEKFVTGAYKKQQEELRLLEKEEKKREAEEEERRKKGGGMTAFHKQMLQKDEERMKAIAEAEKQKEQSAGVVMEIDQEAEINDDETKEAKELNEKGARIVVNDEGEVIDKRQLLGAGLNVAAKKPGLADQKPGRGAESGRTGGQDYSRSSKAQDARQSQRERQSRMMERQIEEMTEKQRQAEIEEQKALEDKNKSKITETDKLSAKERFLQRKREREEEAKKTKGAKAT